MSWQLIEMYDNGTAGANEVARIKMSDDRDVVLKVMLSNKKYHQRRKALTEYTMALLDSMLGAGRVVPDVTVNMFKSSPEYTAIWGQRNSEGAERVCQVSRGYAPGKPGDEWRGDVYGRTDNLFKADEICKDVLANHPDAERISLLDFITINQDRSARNWVTDNGERFYAIDNGMAWFHEYPESDDWKYGCAIDDVILQVGPWQFISGVFTTLWAGRNLSAPLAKALAGFDESYFLKGIDQAAQALDFPPGMSQDWRFEGLLRRMRWIRENNRQPSTFEYRDWYKGSDLFTPPEIVETGGKVVWKLEWDYDLETV